MIETLRRRLANKRLGGFVAQAAVTWGAHVLTGTIAEQEEELEQLRGRVAELEDVAGDYLTRLNDAHSELADVRDRLEGAIVAVAERENLLREACLRGDVDLEQLVTAAALDTYPAPRDVDPLEQGDAAAADAAAAALPDTEPLTLTSQED